MTVTRINSQFLLFDVSIQAQAIMLLAGTGGLPQTENNVHPIGQVKASFPNENFQGMPLLGLSSPPSVAHSKSPNAGLGSCSKIELPAAPKRIQTPASHSNYSEPPKDTRSIAPIATTFIPAGIKPLHSTLVHIFPEVMI